MDSRAASEGRAPAQTGAERLAAMLAASSSAVVLTGAGISVPSGIPDFRTPAKGIWSRFDPMKVAHIDAFRKDPKRFWEFYRPRFHELGAKEPNPAHEALAELERRGLIKAVITQNIDRLHRAAGSQRVIEVHGSIETSSCQYCDATYRLDDVDSLFDEEGVAHCRLCADLVKPDVVLFGEMLPADKMADACRLAADADLMICIGSSLEVHPVAGLPEITMEVGGELVIVTQGPTPYDRQATLKLDGDVVAELTAVLAALG